MSDKEVKSSEDTVAVEGKDVASTEPVSDSYVVSENNSETNKDVSTDTTASEFESVSNGHSQPNSNKINGNEIKTDAVKNNGDEIKTDAVKNNGDEIKSDAVITNGDEKQSDQDDQATKRKCDVDAEAEPVAEKIIKLKSVEVTKAGDGATLEDEKVAETTTAAP